MVFFSFEYWLEVVVLTKYKFSKHIVHTLKILKIGTYKTIAAIVLTLEYLLLQCSNVAIVCKSYGKQCRP